MTVKRQALVDQRVAKALSHPLRAHVLAILNERVASPNDMAEQLGEPLGNVSYHVKALVELDCIELVSTTPAPRRGGALLSRHRPPVLQRPRLEPAAAVPAPGDLGRGAPADLGRRGGLDRGGRVRGPRRPDSRPLCRWCSTRAGGASFTAWSPSSSSARCRSRPTPPARLAESGERGMAAKLVMMQFLSSSARRIDDDASRDGTSREATAGAD